MVGAGDLSLSVMCVSLFLRMLLHVGLEGEEFPACFLLCADFLPTVLLQCSNMITGS